MQKVVRQVGKLSVLEWDHQSIYRGLRRLVFVLTSQPQSDESSIYWLGVLECEWSHVICSHWVLNPASDHMRSLHHLQEKKASLKEVQKSLWWIPRWNQVWKEGPMEVSIDFCPCFLHSPCTTLLLPSGVSWLFVGSGCPSDDDHHSDDHLPSVVWTALEQ